MSSTVGTLEPFDPHAGDWDTYADRLCMYLEANDVKAAKHVATLLTVIGGPAYKVLRNLVSPDKPKDKTFKELVEVLAAHFSPKPLVIAERYRFNNR